MAINHQLAHNTLGILGNIASLLFVLSSVPTIIEMVKRKSSGGLSGDLYVLKLFNCLVWVFYGLPFIHPHDFWVILTNTLGSVFSCCYIIPYLLYASKLERISMALKFLVAFVCFVTMVILLVVFDHSQSNRITIVGIVCTVISSYMHITLLSQCDKVLTSKDPKYFHPNSSVAAFIKGAIWMAYGIVDFDIYIMIPNGIGVLIGMIQTTIVILLCNHQDNDEVTKEQTKEGQIQQEKQTTTSKFSILKAIKRNFLEIFSRYVGREQALDSIIVDIIKNNSSLEGNLDYTKVENRINSLDHAQSNLSKDISRASSLNSLPRISNMTVVPLEEMDLPDNNDSHP